MKNKSILSLLLAVLLLAGGISASAEEKLKIVTTNFPCFDLARSIAGDEANVVNLLPPGSESHSYEPTPADIIAIQEADLFFYVGGESDTWIEGILDSFGNKKPLCLTMSECVTLLEEEQSTSMTTEEAHEHGEKEEHSETEHEHHEKAEMDEHVWTSPVNMLSITEKLTEKLCLIRPSSAPLFQSNAEQYGRELRELDASIREIVAGGKRRTLIFGDRFPFLYFVKEYGLSYDAAFPGCSEDTEPNVRSVISLIDKVRTEAIPVVFYIEFSSRKTADILCEETGAKALLFHSCHNVSAKELEEGATYLNLMKQNALNLKEALNR